MLCGIPSVTGDEAAICAHVEKWARARFETDEVRRVGNALLVAPRSSRQGGEPPGAVENRPPAASFRPAGRPRVGLFGHLDTVLPSPDQTVEIRDGRLYGCGASDMKSGLAVMMEMLERRARYDCDL